MELDHCTQERLIRIVWHHVMNAFGEWYQRFFSDNDSDNNNDPDEEIGDGNCNRCCQWNHVCLGSVKYFDESDGINYPMTRESTEESVPFPEH